MSPNTKFNEFAMYPNLSFSAPEISQQIAKCSTQSDLFSVGCVLYFLGSLTGGRDPFLLQQGDRTSPQAHQTELSMLRSKEQAKLRGLDGELQDMVRGLV